MVQTHGIADLAKEFGVTTRTIRFYEGEGLLAPRREGQKRLFSPRDRVRLKLILRGKRLGFSLSEIAEILDMYDAAPGEKGQLALLLGGIEQRREALKQQRRDIDQTMADLDEVERRCRERQRQIGSGGGS